MFSPFVIITLIAFILFEIFLGWSWYSGNRHVPDISDSLSTEDRLKLADELQRLLDLPLERFADVEAWYAAWHEARQRLGSRYGCFPEFVHRWFSDADIRFEEPKYRVKQDSRIRDLISRYRGGASSVSHANT